LALKASTGAEAAAAGEGVAYGMAILWGNPFYDM